MTGNHLRPQITAGEILLSDFLEPRGLSQSEFSKTVGWPQSKVQDIVSGRRGISPETALVLSYALGTTPDFWLKAQNHHYTCQ
ncbi:MAG: HigA family addiction module antidote protein [Cyanobacteria bacterium SZAS LIN-2]|nr:HigA family addiction module antidote protein [Cyanobacteria bacterium SZAS LIN-3]MBS1995636.1 HigA family addiction module antidote protein [Cyanobacteria bacterium SZAS LIN-2]MBS2009493.1 HigA family addiction module antidote protein [Cyanobacteria bacterium SZAS TMP-1]